MMNMDTFNTRREVPVLNITHEHSVSADTEQEPQPQHLDDQTNRKWWTPMNAIYLLVAITALAGAIVGIIITIQYQQLDESKPQQSEQSKSDQHSVSTTPAPTMKVNHDLSTVRIFAIGNWGASPNVVNKTNGLYGFRDQQDKDAQRKVASLMSTSAATNPTPKLILSQGNNFNWYGLLGQGTQSVETRVNMTFTSMYNGSTLTNIPWALILGKNDVGGGSFLCGESEETLHACGNEKSLREGLRQRIQTQKRSSTSPTSKKRKRKSRGRINEVDSIIKDPRWELHDTYYMKQLSSPDGRTTIDIFNLNVLAHGSSVEICCQCLGYAPPNLAHECPSIKSRSDYCAGGNIAFYKTCKSELSAYSLQALEQFISDSSSSKATFKIVNAHFSPFEMKTKNRRRWLQAIEDANIHLWLHAASPSMNHIWTQPDSSRRLKERKKHSKRSGAQKKPPTTHFILNGIGGGIPSQSMTSIQPRRSDSNVLTLHAQSGVSYGFLDILFNATNMRVKLLTTNEPEAAYCYDIPQDRSHGGHRCS